MRRAYYTAREDVAAGAGAPGTILTFFPWDHVAPGRLGVVLLLAAPAAGYLAPEYALRARARAEHDQVQDDEEVADTETGIPALLFIDLDGARRAVPLVAVDRVEQVEGDSVRFAAGRHRVTIDGRILPLAAQGEIEGRTRLNVLRLKDGANEVSYAIDEALDIITLPEELVPARAPGPIAGVALIDGEQVELLDILWVFDEHADRESEEHAPLCLIAGDKDGWMASFVRPLLETAGYRVATQLTPGETPAVVLSADEASADLAAKAPVVRLRNRRAAAGAGDDSVYRYDRAGLLSALEARVAGATARFEGRPVDRRVDR